jgi:hypothetical protein
MKLRNVLLISVISILTFQGNQTGAQVHRYWPQSFNEMSSLLAGAVVGGGSEASSIFFNPANIADAEYSNLSLNASLFSVESYKLRNALGQDINLKDVNFKVMPRFFSFLLKPKRQGLFLEAAVFTRNEFAGTVSNTVDYNIDILNTLPGEERYRATYRKSVNYSDVYGGLGLSYRLSDRFYAGISMFLSTKSLTWWDVTEIDASPLQDTIWTGGEPVPFYIAGYSSSQYVHAIDYRFIWKAGINFKWNWISLGLNVTTPSVSIYSRGATEVAGMLSQSNITNPDNGQFLPDILIADNQKKKELKANFKDPLSIAIGAAFFPGRKIHKFYFTAEYFTGLQPYKIIESSIHTEIAIPAVYETLEHKDWLTYVSGARAVLNVAVGYSWELSERLLLLGGFKTDFNYLEGLDFGELDDYNKFADVNFDVFHLAAGLRFSIKKHQFFSGIQYSYGHKRNQLQLVNFSDPVEYNTVEQAPLQGARDNSMQFSHNAVSLFIGASLGFGGGK